MDEAQQDTARRCLQGAQTDAMTFPEIVLALIAAGFEGYAVDFRRASAAYYLPDGDSLALPIHGAAVAAAFDAGAVQAAVREAQALAPGYTYAGFCRKAAAAGCAGYMVSFSGRRVLYYGRTAETLVERFPD